MITLNTRAQLRAAILDARLDVHLRAILRLRFEQMSGAGADFHVLQLGDALADAEAAIGWRLVDEGCPGWEWALGHPGGWTEVTFVLSDEGPAQVLLVPTDADAALLRLLHEHG